MCCPSLVRRGLEGPLRHDIRYSTATRADHCRLHGDGRQLLDAVALVRLLFPHLMQIKADAEFGTMQASAQVTVQPSGSIRLSDVQQLLLWTLGDGVSPKWAFIQARVAQGRVSTLEHGLTAV